MRPAAALLAFLLFCVLATMNSAGYRYGASDQAFYIPAVLGHLDPDLFPRDRALIESQSKLMLLDEGLASVASLTGWSLPTVFLVGYVGGLALLLWGLVLLARALAFSAWGTTALVLAMTLRHQIPRTAVNTLEGYLHPRMLAFGLGVLALATFLRGRGWSALAIAIAAGLVHSTTALWFTVWIAVAFAVSDIDARRPLQWIAGAAVVASGWLVWFGPLAERLVVMDEQWLAVLDNKSYLFPTGWGWDTWAMNLAYPVALVALYRARRAHGAERAGERGLVAGALCLCAIFLASLPFIAWRVAFAVQLQISRMFWMLDFAVTVYLVWLLVDSPFWEGRRWQRWRLTPRVAGRVVVAALAVASLARGGYVMWIEHPDRKIFETQLVENAWGDVMAWAARQPRDIHVLADPGHAWRYGTSVRVAGRRDVYQEGVKDEAIAMYSPEIARRVAARRRDLGGFDGLTPERARELAAAYDLHYLVSERSLDLPLAYRNERFRVYDLR